MVYLNIGSNLGQTEQNLDKALEAIKSHFRVPLKVSKPYYSLPWGYTSGNSYTNIGVAFDISVPDPEALLQQLLEIQFKICPKTHRDATGSYIDRVIDIDLIAIDNCVIDTSTLTLPHPRMHLRDFVLIPMAELAPEWLHPVYNLTCSQMFEHLKESQYVEDKAQKNSEKNSESTRKENGKENSEDSHNV